MLAAEYASYKRAQQARSKEADFESGRKDRGERDIWAWAGREQGLTTVLERDHLNVRRARGRPEKERKRMGEVRAVRAAAAQMQMQMAQEGQGQSVAEAAV